MWLDDLIDKVNECSGGFKLTNLGKCVFSKSVVGAIWYGQLVSNTVLDAFSSPQRLRPLASIINNLMGLFILVITKQNYFGLVLNFYWVYIEIARSNEPYIPEA